MEEGLIIRCPGCREGELKFLKDEVDLPHFGEVLISTLICPVCGYRSSDVIPVETREPSRYDLHVTEGSHLSVRVIRSSTSVVRIPEMGVRIDPGTVQEGYITNVEGVLIRIKGVLEHILRDILRDPEGLPDAENRAERTMSLLERIERSIEGELDETSGFHLIIEDPTGNSAIVSETATVKREMLDEKEIMDLTLAMHTSDVRNLDQTPR